MGSLTPRKHRLQSWNGPRIIIAHKWKCVSRTNNKGQKNLLLFRKNVGPSQMASFRRIQLLLLRWFLQRSQWNHLIVILWKKILLRQQKGSLRSLICRVLLWKILNKEPKQKDSRQVTPMLLRMVLVMILLCLGSTLHCAQMVNLNMYMKEIQKRRDAIVDAAASGVLIGDFEAKVPDV